MLSSADGEAVSPVLAGVAREAVALTRASVVAVWIADEGARVLKVGAVGGDADSLAYTVLAFGQGAIGCIAATRAPLEADDVFADSRFLARHWWRSHGLSSFVGLPLVLEDRLLGVFALHSASRWSASLHSGSPMASMCFCMSSAIGRLKDRKSVV